jgi:Domain of unknown function (DUF1963)
MNWVVIGRDHVLPFLGGGCFLERIAISLDNKVKSDWPKDIREACVSWVQRASTERSTDRIPEAIVDEFCNWLRRLATRDQTFRYRYVEPSIQDAIIAAWPYVAFSGDLSDLPAELVQDQYFRPLDHPKSSGHHKMLGDAMSVQHVQLADEDNVLLLRLDSDYPLDFCWGDAGVLQITITRNDLSARNFEHTSLNADCP